MRTVLHRLLSSAFRSRPRSAHAARRPLCLEMLEARDLMSVTLTPDKELPDAPPLPSGRLAPSFSQTTRVVAVLVGYSMSSDSVSVKIVGIGGPTPTGRLYSNGNFLAQLDANGVGTFALPKPDSESSTPSQDFFITYSGDANYAATTWVYSQLLSPPTLLLPPAPNPPSRPAMRTAPPRLMDIPEQPVAAPAQLSAALVDQAFLTTIPRPDGEGPDAALVS